MIHQTVASTFSARRIETFMIHLLEGPWWAATAATWSGIPRRARGGPHAHVPHFPAFERGRYGYLVACESRTRRARPDEHVQQGGVILLRRSGRAGRTQPAVGAGEAFSYSIGVSVPSGLRRLARRHRRVVPEDGQLERAHARVAGLTH